MSDMWEVEQKYIVGHCEQLVKRLLELGATEYDTQQHTDTYFAHPCRNLRQTDEAFRLRCVGDEAMVTYKGPRLPSVTKTRPEIELKIVASETVQWLQIYDALGFRALPSIKKVRRAFQIPFNGRIFNVALDRVELLGDFAEIELLVSRREELSEAGSEIELLGKLLNLDQVQPKSYISLLLAKLGVE